MGKTPKESEIELRPDGYERFRQAVHAAAKSGRIPAPKKQAGKKGTKKGRT